MEGSDFCDKFFEEMEIEYLARPLTQYTLMELEARFSSANEQLRSLGSTYRVGCKVDKKTGNVEFFTIQKVTE